MVSLQQHQVMKFHMSHELERDFLKENSPPTQQQVNLEIDRCKSLLTLHNQVIEEAILSVNQRDPDYPGLAAAKENLSKRKTIATLEKVVLNRWKDRLQKYGPYLQTNRDKDCMRKAYTLQEKYYSENCNRNNEIIVALVKTDSLLAFLQNESPLAFILNESPLAFMQSNWDFIISLYSKEDRHFIDQFYEDQSFLESFKAQHTAYHESWDSMTTELDASLKARKEELNMIDSKYRELVQDILKINTENIEINLYEITVLSEVRAALAELGPATE
eukprot:3936592-Rhodomonas_salina.2